MAGSDFRISLGFRGIRPAEIVRAPRPEISRVVGDPLEFAAERLIQIATRDAMTSSPSGVARVNWSQTPQEDIYDPMPAHPGIRHHTLRTSIFVRGQFHTPREVGNTPPPSTACRLSAAREGLLTPSELLGPLPTMYADATHRLLSDGVRIHFRPNGCERTTRGTMKPRPTALSGGRFISARKLIQLHPVDIVDPAFSLAQVIDYLRFMTDAYALGDRFGLVFPPWNNLPEHDRSQVRYAWTLSQVYVDALRHAANLRTLRYIVDREPWNTWLRDPQTAKDTIYNDVIISCGLSGKPWSKDLLRAMSQYPLRAIRDGKLR